MQLSLIHSVMIHGAFIKQLLYTSIKDTKKIKLPSKKLQSKVNSCAEAEVLFHFDGKGTQIGKFSGNCFVCPRLMQYINVNINVLMGRSVPEKLFFFFSSLCLGLHY